MSEEIKEIPLKERIEKLLESGWVNEFNYLESQLQEARYLVVILQQKVEQLEKELQITANKCKQLENIRKDAIKYVRKNQSAYVELLGNTIPIQELFTTNINLLNILNKGSDKE